MPLPSPAEFAAQPMKSITIFGMSGVGKTRLAKMLRSTADWFHYSVDYRIGTRHMGEQIADELKREAMTSPMLRELLMTDSIEVRARLTFENLRPLSAYLGRPGDRAEGGLPFEEFVRRQRQHRDAEIQAMRESAQFMERAHALYGYRHFLCDTSGSFVEVVDPADARDPLLSELSARTLVVGIAGTPEDEDELVRRFEADPKPMYYEEAFLRAIWAEYLEEQDVPADSVHPKHFAVWAFRRLVSHRAPRYQAIADNWGLSITKAELAQVQNEADFMGLIEDALARGAT